MIERNPTSGASPHHKNESYYSGSRDDLIRLIPAGTRKVLEIGCAAGMTGKTLKGLGFEEVVGVEISEDMADKAQAFMTGSSPVMWKRCGSLMRKGTLTASSMETSWSIWLTRGGC
jgi:hypothetical protein